MMCSRPTLLMLCGLLSDAEVWYRVAQQLHDAADVHIIDFRGLDSIDSMVARVLGHRAARIALAGHSMGGRVALQTWRADPARVTAMALLNTGVHATASHEFEQRGRLVELARREGMRALAQAWLPGMLDAARVPDPDLFARLQAMVERESPEGFAAHIRALLNRPEAATVLSSISVPLLLVSATGDRWSPPAQHEAMQRQVPGARLEIIDNAGHMTPAEQPVIVADTLRKWLGALQRPREKNPDVR